MISFDQSINEIYIYLYPFYPFTSLPQIPGLQPSVLVGAGAQAAESLTENQYKCYQEENWFYH